jgi:hypothetical protein
MNGGDTRQAGPGNAPSSRRDDDFVCDEELVSVDFLHDDRSSIVDAPLTMAIGDRMVKVMATRMGLRMPPARLGRVGDQLQVGFGTAELRQGWPPVRSGRQSVDPAWFWAARSMLTRRETARASLAVA